MTVLLAVDTGVGSPAFIAILSFVVIVVAAFGKFLEWVIKQVFGTGKAAQKVESTSTDAARIEKAISELRSHVDVALAAQTRRIDERFDGLDNEVRALNNDVRDVMTENARLDERLKYTEVNVRELWQHVRK